MQEGLLTRHAKQRLRQRGVRNEVFEIVLAYGDIEIPSGDGCRFLRLSNTGAGALLQRGEIPVQVVDQARRLLVLVGRSGKIVTAIKCNPNRRFRSRR